VFVLTAVRQVGRLRLRIWQIMLCGALAVLVTGTTSPERAFGSIDWGVIAFLFAMFVVGEGLIRSGYLQAVSHRIFRNAASVDRLVLALIISFGLLSAFLMNDTLAIIGTGLVLGYAKKFGISEKLLLLALAVAVTTGSVMSPIGNPQNLLVAQAGGLSDPFTVFFLYLAVPTLVNLAIAFLVLRWFYRQEFHSYPLVHTEEPVASPRLAFLAKISVCTIAVLVAAKVVLSFIAPAIMVPLPFIAVCAALPLIIFSEERIALVKNIDWRTLVFFSAMFVLMASVWDSGFFQSLLGADAFTTVPAILGLSIVLSQFISNVPFVALFQPMILQAGEQVPNLMALAAGSTIAGNLTILGAASNVIIIQNAERQGATLTFREFLRVGIPLTLAQVFVYWGFLSFL
jgi:Na+/H+ antiporter NhaD/arsenite permease-like protein